MTPIENVIEQLSKDLKTAARTLSATEARFLVDGYYMMQENRKRAASQVLALSTSNEPHETLAWFLSQSERLENQVRRALDAYSDSSALGSWARQQVGIGPVIAAGLLAHIDVNRPTVGHIWRFAGLDPTSHWGKGEKRPWNAALKTLCWKIGESFVKVSGNPDAFYGQLYVQRKAEEQARNDAGNYADQAAAILTAKKIGKTTEAYKAYSTGKLPPAHIHARAKRWAVKMFLAHYWEVGNKLNGRTDLPLPYAVAHLRHAHVISPPAINFD